SSVSRTLSLSFFFTAPPTTETYTLSLHDALPIYPPRTDDARPRRVEPDRHGPVGLHPQRTGAARVLARRHRAPAGPRSGGHAGQDRKSTRLNSSHVKISYAVFCLKKKTRNKSNTE